MLTTSTKVQILTQKLSAELSDCARAKRGLGVDFFFSKVETKVAEVKKGPQIGAGRGIKITAKPGGGDVGGSSSYKISNREATRDMDWLCAISSMEGLLCIYVLM